MRALLLLPLLVPPLVLADVGLKQGNTVIGPVRDISCKLDGGLACSRDAGSAIGGIQCLAATSTSVGCVSTTTQTFAGNKTFTGNIVTPLIDAGIGAIGTTDIRANAFTGRDTASTLTIQSNTSDGTTSSTVAATTFKLGSALTAGDLGWRFQNSSGTKALGITGDGILSFHTMVTDAVSVTQQGTDFSATLSTGGAANGGLPGGSGGDSTWSAGAGGASDGVSIAGSGGALTFYSGSGGASSGALAGGSGGSISIFAGLGHAGASSGGNVVIQSGTGTAATASLAPSPGGSVTISAASSGAAGVGGTTGATGGALTISSGNGGASTVGQTSGAGGAITITTGTAGATTGGTGAEGGDLTITTGDGSGSDTAGDIFVDPGGNDGYIGIGDTNAADVQIGHNTARVYVSGEIRLNGNPAVEISAPTVSSGFGTSPAVTGSSSLAFRVTVGNPTAASGVFLLGLTATNGWNCTCADLTTQSSTVFLCKQTASSTTSATIGNFDAAGASQNWVAGDVLSVICAGM
jgi:hypothetical protein